jgi:hypothetical protein
MGMTVASVYQQLAQGGASSLHNLSRCDAVPAGAGIGILYFAQPLWLRPVRTPFLGQHALRPKLAQDKSRLE